MEILGHSQMRVTMNIYAHVTQQGQREALAHMDRLLGRATDGNRGCHVHVLGLC
jgi:hypothetical protein